VHRVSSGVHHFVTQLVIKAGALCRGYLVHQRLNRIEAPDGHPNCPTLKWFGVSEGDWLPGHRIQRTNLTTLPERCPSKPHRDPDVAETRWRAAKGELIPPECRASFFPPQNKPRTRSGHEARQEFSIRCTFGAVWVLFGCWRRIGSQFCPSSALMAQAMSFSVGTKLPRHCIHQPTKP